MRGTFLITEVVAMLNLRFPLGVNPACRLQNFLLGNSDWKTSQEASSHIGERGELDLLRTLLPTETRQIYHLQEQFGRRYQGEVGNLTFPTDDHYQQFVHQVEEVLGREVIIEV